VAISGGRASALSVPSPQWLQRTVSRALPRESVFHPARPPFWQIGTDGGLLDRPVEIDEGATSGVQKLLLAPAERADLIVDFAGFNGRTLTLVNTANAPYPSGDAPDPQANGQIMQFPG